MKMDKEYWILYYNSKLSEERAPSHFAQYIIDQFLNTIRHSDGHRPRLIELGCGDGRDSIYFSNNNIEVIAVDQVSDVIESLKSENRNKDSICFRCDDFTSLNTQEMFDIVYSRFTMHSINSREQDRVLDWAYGHLSKNGLFCIEARGKNNELFKQGEKVESEDDAYIHDHHYRRFIDVKELCNQLLECGFSVIYSAEKEGFAPYKGTNETYFRVIAKR